MSESGKGEKVVLSVRFFFFFCGKNREGIMQGKWVMQYGEKGAIEAFRENGRKRNTCKLEVLE